ncbi:hypothetical protein VTG60DRAFT_2747 [Thermothelomyces hinnuleus]
MCLRLSRTCPGCGVVADSSETDTCDNPADCNGFTTYKLPLRREHHNEWACSTPRCPFNHEYVYDLEREYLRVRLAQRGGVMQTLAPHLTLDDRDILDDDSGPRSGAPVNLVPERRDGAAAAAAGNQQMFQEDSAPYCGGSAYNWRSLPQDQKAVYRAPGIPPPA